MMTGLAHRIALNSARTQLQLGNPRGAMELVTTYALQRYAVLVARDAGWLLVESTVGWAWLAICVYSWVAPILFQRTLDQ